MFVTLITVVAFALVALRSLQRPGAALALAMTMFAFDQVLNANSAFFAANQALLNYAVGGVCALALAVGFATGTYRFRGAFHPVSVCVFGFLGLALVATQWSINPFAFSILRIQFPYLALQVVIAPLLLGYSKDAKVALYLAAWITAAVTAYVAADPSIWWSTQRLALVVAGNPTQVSNPLALGDVGGAAFILAVLAPGFERWSSRQTLLRYAVCAVSLLVTAKASRGETVAALLSTLVFFVALGAHRDRARSKSMALVVLALIAGAVVFSVFTSEVGSRYQQGAVEGDVNIRFNLIEVVLARFAASPEAWLFGLGTNGTLAVLRGSYPHNHIVQALVEYGIVGLGLWLSILLCAFSAVFRAWRTLGVNDERRFVLAGLGAFLLYHFIVGFKRGGPMDGNLFMYALLCERFALAVRVEPAAETATSPLNHRALAS